MYPDKKRRRLIALYLLFAGAILCAVIYMTPAGMEWLDATVFCIGMLILVIGGMYLKAMYPGKRYPQNTNNKEWE